MDVSSPRQVRESTEKVSFPDFVHVSHDDANSINEKTDHPCPKTTTTPPKKVSFQESVHVIPDANEKRTQEPDKKAEQEHSEDTGKGKGPEQTEYHEYESFPAYPGSPPRAEFPVCLPPLPRISPPLKEYTPSLSPTPSNPPSRPRSLSGRVAAGLASGLTSLFRSRSESSPVCGPTTQPPREGTSIYCKYA